MELQVLSDHPLVDDVWQVLIQTCRNYPAITGIHEIGLTDNVLPDQPLLVLGKPERAKGLTPTTVMPLSVKSILGTSGGGAKLDHAIRLIAEPTDDVARVTLSTPPEWSGQRISVDIEVSGDIEVDEPEDTEMLSIAVACRSAPDEIRTYAFGLEQLSDPTYKGALYDLLQSNMIRLHNGKFDCRWINPWLGSKIYPNDDTMLMHACLYPAAGENGLKDLAKRMFNAPDWEVDLKKYTRGKAHFERIPQPVLLDYNQWDVYWTERLYMRLHDELHAPDNAAARSLYYDHVLPASHMLQDVEQYGMGIDMQYADNLHGQLTEAIYQIKETLFDMTSSDTFNPRSPLQVKKFFASIGISMGSTDEKSLNNLVMRSNDDKVVSFVKNLLDFRGLDKINGTYVEGITKKVRNGRVHPTFLLHGTSTGRLSSRRPNAQNLKNDEEGRPSVKRMFVSSAERATVLIGCDYAQAELRTMAELSGDEKMIADLQADSPDFFDNMMPDVFPIEVDPYDPEKILFDITKLDKAQRKPYRLRLKRVVYGTSYGLGANACATLLTLEGTPTTVGEATMIQRGYLGRYAGLRAWRESVLPRVLRGDDLTTPFGRRFQQDTVTAGYVNRVQNMAWSFLPQSIASDICVRAAMTLHSELQSMGGSVIALVHDAIYAEVPAEYGNACGELIALRMKEAAATIFKRVPFLTEWHIGKTLAEV